MMIKRITNFLLSGLLIIFITLSFTNISGFQTIVWQKASNGLFGGVVTSICGDPVYKNIIYAGTVRGGVYVSNDSGLNWVSKNNGLKNLYVYSLLATGKRVLAGTEDFIFISDDHGENWRKVSEELIETKVNVLKILNNTEKILAGTNKGLFISNDGGLNWEKAYLVIPIDVIAIAVDQDNTVYISGRGKLLFKSADGGKSWIDLKGGENLFEFQSLLIDSRNSQIIYGGTSEKGVWRSSNGGRSWVSLSEGLENLYISSLFQWEESKEIFASTYGGLFILSEDNNLWKRVGSTLFNKNIICFTHISNLGFICGTNGGGIFLLRDIDSNGIWRAINSGLDNVHIRSIKCFGSGERLLAATWGAGIFKSIDFGNSWTPQNEGLTNPLVLCIAGDGKNVILAGTFNDGIFKSNNYGDSWEKLYSPTLFSRYVYSIAVDYNNPKNIFAGTNEGIYRSVDEGGSWAKVFPLDTDTKIGEIVDIKINIKNSKIIFASSNGSGIFVSKDGGDSWLPTNSGLTNLNVLSIAFDPFSDNTIYVSTFGSGVYKSIDGGASWNSVNEGLTNSFVYDIFIEASKGYIIASTEAGIFISFDKAKSWTYFGEGLENISVREVCFNPQDLKFYAGTYGNGVFKSIRIPDTPVPMSPQDGSKITTLRPTLIWSEIGGSDIPFTYSIQVSKDSSFGEILFEKSDITGNQFILPEGIIQKGGRYFWRVKVSTQVKDSTWSKAYSFYTITRIILRINDPLMQVDSENREIDPGRGTTPVIREGRTFLPIRSIIEALSGSISWDELNKKVTIELGNVKIELVIGSNFGIVNGKEVQIDPNNPKVVPFILNGRTMLPLRFIAENIGANVDWETQTQTVTIIYPAIP